MRNQSPRLACETPANAGSRGADQNRTGVAGVTPDPYFRFLPLAAAFAFLLLLGGLAGMPWWLGAV